MSDDLMHALDSLPPFICKDGKFHNLMISRVDVTWVIFYLENFGQEMIFKTGCCSLLKAAQEIYETLGKEKLLNGRRKRKTASKSTLTLNRTNNL
jgi:hypothetical protein